MVGWLNSVCRIGQTNRESLDPHTTMYPGRKSRNQKRVSHLENEPRPRNFPLSFYRLQERRPRILISVVALQPRPSIAVRTGLFHEFLAPLKPCFRFFRSMFFVRRRGELLTKVSRRSRMSREPYSWYFRWCWRNVNGIFIVEKYFFPLVIVSSVSLIFVIYSLNCC